ncbi:hypothetical protein GCM10010172_19500 [Paractinoplanes ferrugineus]|uniref:Tat pathway signal protein n=1 Tax=Paractinoplanes ferrugineus TaxID=113564 RepID=A0A919MIN6_9ACTN|nr:hypothetical protein [Actinoplanes ferrugineus]GIE16219.1 hypothetical protein Afe05nite_80590 [Actinoplanes ferrugineus]
MNGQITRRTMLGGVAAGAGAVLALPSLAVPAAAAEDFDWDNGNAAFSIVVAEFDPIILNYITGGDATLVIRLNLLIAVSMFDAIAPYHPTAVGVHSNLGRRPAGESATNRNKNIALVYATYRAFLTALPFSAGPKLRAVLTKYGLDPDDDQENTTTAVGIGNRAGRSVIAARLHDGANMLGDIGWGPYNRQPYRDYSDYQPVNTVGEVRDLSRWQPAVFTNKGGTYRIQQALTPFFGRVRPYTFTDAREFLLPAPANSDFKRNPRGYREQAETVLAHSAALTDVTKMKAEIFNDKIYSLGYSLGAAAVGSNLSFDEIIQLNAVTAVSEFDAIIACWYNKFRYDTVRPFTAIRYLFKNKRVTAWGGPGKGTVHDLPGSQWTSYLDVNEHPEYPSGSSVLCSTHTQAAIRYLKSDALDLTYQAPRGTSLVEPGVTPARDLALHFSSWTEFGAACRASRLDGGVHFPAATTAGLALGTQFGDLGYEFVQARIEGRAHR